MLLSETALNNHLKGWSGHMADISCCSGSAPNYKHIYGSPSRTHCGFEHFLKNIYPVDLKQEWGTPLVVSWSHVDNNFLVQKV